MGEFASASILDKTSILSGLHVLLSEAIQSDILAHCKLTDLLFIQNLLIFPPILCGGFQSSPDQDTSEIWALKCLLLTGAAMAFNPLTMDAMGLACHIRAKLWFFMFEDASANVRQELMMALLISLQLVDLKKAKEALKAALQVAKVVTQPPLTPQPSKPSSASVKLQSAPKQVFSQMGTCELKDKSLTFALKLAFGKSLSFPGQHSSEKSEGSSSCKSFACRFFVKSSLNH